MDNQERLKQKIEKLEGYKIRDTHFKVGSKIHSRDFYYAKRLFQNSFYTSRIALLLAQRIYYGRGINKESLITLVGYELYSELLLSLIQKYLSELGCESVKHFIVTDTNRRLSNVPDIAITSGIFVIIVPIASTGSTALKIEDHINKNKGDANISFLQPHFNVFRAIDENAALPSEVVAEQEPLIILRTEWQKPIDCRWCYNDERSTPLFETDKASLTPSLIFGLPSRKEKNDYSVSFNNVDFTNALKYKQIKRNEEYFLFSTDTDVLIANKGNRSLINQWLENIRNKIKISSSDKVIIISPCHYSNSSFINIVNDKLFNSAATIIYHQSDVDYMANFKLLNRRYIGDTNTKIYFVDDTVISGRSFFTIYDLYRFASGYDDNKKFMGAIILCNKSLDDTTARINRATDKNLFTFVDINMPLPPKIFDKKPLEHEINRYKELSRIVVHDVLKAFFGQKGDDLGNFSLKRSTRDNDETKQKAERHHRMFVATHKLYEYFGGNNFDDKIAFPQLLKACGFSYSSLEERLAVMKVLSQYPFLLYMPIRKLTFAWHKTWLNSLIETLIERLSAEDKKVTISYEEFQEVKFLIRRAVFLGNHRILSDDFFRFIHLFFELLQTPGSVYRGYNRPEGELHIKESFIVLTDENKAEMQNITDFYLFLLCQYIELIHKNTWCAKVAVEGIAYYKDKSIPLPMRRCLRMLEIEVAGVLHDFYLLVKSKSKWNERSEIKNGKIYSVDSTYDIEEFLKGAQSGKLLEKNKFLLARQVLNLEENDGSLKIPFLNYLWVKRYIGADFNSELSTNTTLSEKTEQIFNKFKGFFDNTGSVGAFFIVKDGRGDQHLVYDRNNNNQKIFNNEFMGSSLIDEFLKGHPYDSSDGSINDSFHSIKEYERSSDDDAIWIDLYSIDNKPAEKQMELPSNIKWLLMIRLSGTNNNTKNTELGTMVFYGDKILQHDTLAKQLLMLMRKDMSEFIVRHHKNDEFAYLREIEAVKRFAYLAGHGREMMQRLSKTEGEGKEMFESVISTMERLQYLIATKWLSNTGYNNEEKKKTNRELLLTVIEQSKIDTDSHENIKTMAMAIYKSEMIENKVELEQEDIRISSEIESSFDFSWEIVRFICFELLVNAKKNRYNYVSEHCNKCGVKKNRLEIKFSIESSCLKIEIAGTGPEIPDEVLTKIRHGLNIKDEHEIAGLNLIRNVIKSFNNNNYIIAESNPEASCCGRFLNKFIVLLYPFTNE